MRFFLVMKFRPRRSARGINHIRAPALKACAFAAVCLSALAASAQSGSDARNANWPGFRGSDAQGISEGSPAPIHWNVEESQNVRWKTPVPGLAHSSPIIWGDRIFITTAISEKRDPQLKVGLYGNIESVQDESVHEWKVYCVEKSSGRIVWDRVAHRGVPKIKRHPKSTHASSTPATDGQHVVAFFGSEGLYCYDMDGRLLWEKDLGVLDSGFYVAPTAQWGFGSSPILHEGVVIVQCDVQKSSFLAAFDADSGEQLWRTARDDVPTWSTPTIVTSTGRHQVVVNGFNHIGGYDFATGAELWKLRGGGDIPVPTPILGHGLIFITNAHGRMSPIYAIRPDAKGDISLEGDETSNDHVVWSIRRGGGYMQTPIVYGDHLYVCRANGVLSCLDAKTGERVYQQRLGSARGGFSASPVAADGKIYFTGETGEIYVVRAGPEFELLAVNSMGEICMATPAISEGTLFFRTRAHLVAVR